MNNLKPNKMFETKFTRQFSPKKCLDGKKLNLFSLSSSRALPSCPNDCDVLTLLVSHKVLLFGTKTRQNSLRWRRLGNLKTKQAFLKFIYFRYKRSHCKKLEQL